MNLLARVTAILAVFGVSACSDYKRVDSALILQSEFGIETREFGLFSVDQVTSAPIQYFGAVQLNAVPEKVYSYVGDLESIGEWLPVAGEVTQLDHTNSQTPGEPGQGTLRHVESATGSSTIVETISYWQDGVGYGYSIPDDAGLAISGHLAMLLVESDGQGGSLVTYRQYYTPESFVVDITAPVMRFMLNKALGNLADKFGGEVL